MSDSTPEARVALVGHPNAGKTTLFNALTGQNQKVGNYTGVTVEKRTGTFRTPHGKQLEIIDLPGSYSLIPNSPDEAVTRDALLGDLHDESLPDLVLCVLDATNLERHLYLLQQTLDLGVPALGVINKVDLAEAAGLRLDLTQLSEDFDIPFVAISGTSDRGVTQLKQAIRFPFPPAPGRTWSGSDELEKALTALTEELAKKNPRPEVHALQLLTDPKFQIEGIQQSSDFEDEISQRRFATVQSAVENGVRRPEENSLQLTDKIDNVALHPIFGWFLFSGIMLGIFWSLFSLSGPPMDLIEGAIGSLGDWVSGLMPEGDFRNLLVDGIIGGVGSVVVFLPQIVMLFFFISLLESTGYMARAAFLMDKVMCKVGLSGKSFLPLLSGYACAIPGVMATRTIPSAKERLATILILPWTSCSARLPVYVILVPLFITGSVNQTLMLFGIYALGTVTALLAAKLLMPRLGPADPPQFLLELPPYHKPDLGYVFRQVIDRALAFLKKAGTVILGISILLWFLNTFPKSDSDDPASQQANSFMGRAGTLIEPIVKPLGWDARLGTAMLTSFAAREVFVSSLAISYSVDEEEEDQLKDTLAKATHSDGSKLFSTATILSLLVFYIYALQCLPTTAVVRRETNSWAWALGQLGGMTAFAYLAALIAYQIGGML